MTHRPHLSHPNKLVRWLVFGLALAGGGGLPLILPPPYSSFIALALIAGVIGLILRPGGAAARAELSAVNQDFRRLIPSRVFFLRGLIVVACGLMVLSTIVFRPGNGGETGVGLHLAIWSSLTLGLALWLAKDRGHSTTDGGNAVPTDPSAAMTAPLDRPIRWYPVLSGLAALILVAFINQLPATVLIMTRVYTNIHVQFALWLGGIVLLVWGLTGGGSIRRFFTHVWQRAYTLPLLITLLALGLRVVNLELGVHRFIDEFHSISGVVGIWDKEQIYMFLPFNPVAMFPWTYSYLNWLFVGIFGPSMASLRLASALIGTLTIPALYFMVKTLFDRKTALIAALLLATFPPHIHFSRFALNNIADPLFAVLALGFIGRGFQFNRRRDWVYAGVMLGLSQYFYEGGRLLFPPLVVAWLGWIGIQHVLGRRLGLKPLFSLAMSRFPWQSLLFFGLVAVIIAAPLYLTYVTHSLTLTPRMDKMAVNDEWMSLLPEVNTFSYRLRNPLLLLVQEPDGSWFYSGETPLILPYVVLPFFLLGVAHALWRLRIPGMALLLGWVLATALGNTLMRTSIDVPRYVVVFPALAALVAVGLLYTGRLLQAAWTRLTVMRVGRVLWATLIVAVASFQAWYYFAIHQVEFRPPPDDLLGISDMFFRMVELPRNTHVYIIYSNIIWGSNIYYVQRFWGRQDDLMVMVYNPEDFANIVNTIPPAERYAFFVEPYDFDTMAIIRAYFHPGVAQISPYGDVPKEKQMLLFYASRDDPAR